jgi:hypothetical protein
MTGRCFLRRLELNDWRLVRESDDFGSVRWSQFRERLKTQEETD